MVVFTATKLFALIFAGLSLQTHSFAPVSKATAQAQLQSYKNSFGSLLAGRQHPEFSLMDEDETLKNDEHEKSSGTDFIVVNQKEVLSSEPSRRPEYGALSPGTVVQVQVGDLSLARKAWKKRRRTGSPLLVPCSVLNVDRQSMVRWNLIYLLEKFGNARSDGIEITATELSKKYRTFLKSSLQKQADALSCESSQDLITKLFNKKTQDSYGIRLATKKDGQLVLKAPISRRKAQNRASATPILQFRLPRQGDYENHDIQTDALTHTGYLRARRHSQDNEDRSYHFLPLSAALRVSQKDDVDTGRVEEGSVHAAVVFDYDLAGDGGSPLLTLSLNPRGSRESLKVKPDRKYQPIENPKHLFHKLHAGDGPFRAKVVRLLPGRALVDMDVGRKTSSGGIVRVMGTLRFKDSVEVETPPNDLLGMNQFSMEMADEEYNYDDDGTLDTIESALFDFDDDYDDEEENEEESEDNLAEQLLSLRKSDTFEEGTFEDGETEEDISHQFSLTEDGSLTHVDPKTGDIVVVDSGSDDDEGDDEEEEDVDMLSLFETNEDGTVAFVDPESGETLEVDSEDEDFEDMLMIKSLIDKYSQPPSPKNVDYIHTEVSPSSKSPSQPTISTENMPSRNRSFVTKMLRVGEDIEVYIRSVSKQSSQFTVSTDPYVQGRKAKDLKKESEANKRVQRLKKSLGGSLHKIWQVQGRECTGVVKATSKTGEWAYVQPELEGLPVGVATLAEEAGHPELSSGDIVTVRMVGIDENRGQLAMELLSKDS